MIIYVQNNTIFTKNNKIYYKWTDLMILSIKKLGLCPIRLINVHRLSSSEELLKIQPCFLRWFYMISVYDWLFWQTVSPLLLA